MRAGMLLLQNSAPVHMSQVTVVKSAKCGFELLPDAPYSLDIAPSDCFWLPKLKSHPRDNRFHSNNDAIHAFEGYLRDQDGSVFHEKILQLGHWGNKCFEV